MESRVCPACGERALVATTRDIAVPLRGKKWVVTGFAHDMCQACGERPMTGAQIDALRVRAADKAQHARGLLGPSDIRCLRADLGLSQRGLEEALGTGEKTVVRWESGTVFPNATANTLMRFIWENPRLLGETASPASVNCANPAREWIDVSSLVLSAPVAAPVWQESANNEHALAA